MFVIVIVVYSQINNDAHSLTRPISVKRPQNAKKHSLTHFNTIIMYIETEGGGRQQILFIFISATLNMQPLLIKDIKR